eukprot:2660319-Amphidinium_carterae.1
MAPSISSYLKMTADPSKVGASIFTRKPPSGHPDIARAAVNMGVQSSLRFSFAASSRLGPWKLLSVATVRCSASA